jgi:hypothetical protein
MIWDLGGQHMRSPILRFDWYSHFYSDYAARHHTIHDSRISEPPVGDLKISALIPIKENISWPSERRWRLTREINAGD